MYSLAWYVAYKHFVLKSFHFLAFVTESWTMDLSSNISWIASNEQKESGSTYSRFAWPFFFLSLFPLPSRQKLKGIR